MKTPAARSKRTYGPSIVRTQGSIPQGHMSQSEVARVLGISQMRVSQLERQALAKLRAVLCKGTTDG